MPMCCPISSNNNLTRTPISKGESKPSTVHPPSKYHSAGGSPIYPFKKPPKILAVTKVFPSDSQ